MGLLRRVRIRGYQSIVNADLVLGDVTVVVGESDTGKTSLVRALRDWAYGARGEYMISAGSHRSLVSVQVGDRWWISWERMERLQRGGRMRFIKRDLETNRAVRYERPGAEAPQEIRSITGFFPLDLGDGLKVRPNLQEQGDPWFLLANPPWTEPATAKVVGRVSGLSALADALREVSLEAAAHKTNAGRAAKDLVEWRSRLAAFVSLDLSLELVARARIKLEEAAAARRVRDSVLSELRRAKDARRAGADARARAGALRGALEAVDALGLEGRLRDLEGAEHLYGFVEASEKILTDRRRRAEEARAELEEARGALLALADSGGSTCPACGLPSHPECVEELRRLAAEE